MTAFLNSQVIVTILIGSAASTPLGQRIGGWFLRGLATGGSVWRRGGFAAAYLGVLAVLFVAAVAHLAAGTYNPFIYFGSEAMFEHKRFDRVVILLFLLGISLPLAFTSFAWRSEVEKRVLAPFPGLPRTLAALHAFPRGFEAFYNDHFGFRERLVALYSRAMVRLGISPTTQVVIGRDGWFFYASPGDGNALEDYRNNDPLTEAELAVWERDLRAKRDWLASQGIAYLFVIAPSKSTVYGEFMPANIRRVSDVSRADQLVARARQADLPVLDLRPVLLTQKAGGALLYDKAGSHWNAWGANLAQAALAEGLAARGVTLAPQRYALADFAVEPAGGETDLAGMMGLGEAVSANRPWPSHSHSRCVRRLR